MKKMILTMCVLGMLPGLGMAFDGELKFSKKQYGMTHQITVSNWQVDKKGVPSFDYVYSHKGAACAYEIRGTAQALMEDNGKPVVINSGSGAEEEQIIPFSDKTVDFAFPYKKKEVGDYLGFTQKFTPSMLKNTCVKKAGLFEVNFLKNGK